MTLQEIEEKIKEVKHDFAKDTIHWFMTDELKKGKPLPSFEEIKAFVYEMGLEDWL